MKWNVIVFLGFIFAIASCANAAEQSRGMFLMAPFYGSLSSDIKFSSPGGSGTNTLSDLGALY